MIFLFWTIERSGKVLIVFFYLSNWFVLSFLVHVGFCKPFDFVVVDSVETEDVILRGNLILNTEKWTEGLTGCLPSNVLLKIDHTFVCHLGFNSLHWPKAQVGFNSWYSLLCHSNFMFSMTKMENLKWQISENINFVTLLVQKLKILNKQSDLQSVPWLRIFVNS